MAYTTIDFLQGYTRRVYSTTTTPTAVQVQEYIDMAEDEVNELTGRKWEVTTVTERFYAPGTNEILLDKYPVNSITSVVGPSGDAVSFEQRHQDFVKLTGSYNVDYIDVTYQYGFTVVPAAIKWLTTLYAVQKIVQSASTSSSNTESISVGPISISNAVGRSAVINLEKDISKYESKIRRIVR